VKCDEIAAAALTPVIFAVAEEPALGPVHGRPPGLHAAPCLAPDLDVAAARGAGGRALARFPGHRDRARLPGM